MKAGLFKKWSIMLFALYATARISILNIFKVYLGGGYSRAYADKIFRWYANALCRSVKMRDTMNDPHHLKFEPGIPYMVMSNHRSHYDIPLAVKYIPGSVRMLTKQELRKVPIWGKSLSVGEFVFIDRSDLEKAKQSLAEARRVMESGVVLWVAAEGTRSRDGRLGEFKKGGFITAIEAGATIIPVGVIGSEKVLPPKTWEFHLDQEVEFTIGAPIDASRYTLDNKEDLIAEVRDSIAHLCGEA
jgi:1-acyl-sn-glycerol-3-phosphate acyltransferase